MSRACRIFLSCCLILLLCGCWDGVDIEDRASILSLSFDWKDGKYDIGATLPVPYKLEAGASGGGAQHFVNVEATTLSEAFNKMTLNLQRPIYFGQTVVFVFSREVAEKGLEPILDYLRRSEEIRSNAILTVVEGNAGKFIQRPTTFWELSMEELQNDIEVGEDLGYAFRSRFGGVLVDQNTISKGVPILNMISFREKEYQWDGAAIFNRSKMVYKLSDIDLTGVMNQIRNKNMGLAIRVPYKKGTIAYHPSSIDREIQFLPDAPSPKMVIKVNLDGYIEEKTFSIDLEKTKNIEDISKAIAKEYEKRAQKVIQLGRELHLDLFQLRHHIRMNHAELWDQYKSFSQFEKLPIEVEYEVNIRDSGVEKDGGSLSGINNES